MKISEIHKTFKTMMDKNAESVAFGGCPAFLSEEIDLFLNQAYVEVICNKYTGTNTLRVPFEGSVKRIQDLEGLVKTDKGISVKNNTKTAEDNVLQVENLLTTVASGSTPKNDKMFFVSAVLHWGEDGDNRPNAATIQMIDHLSSDKFLLTHNNSPWIPVPVATISDNTLKVFVDPTTTDNSFTIDITYVKFPEKINYKTPDVNINEVPDRVMYEVINRAVLIALENIESKRTETKINLNNLQE